MILFYDKPAAEWVEAIPIGNGRIGAMVFGGTAEELIQFNEDTFWTGEPYNPVNPGALDALPEARRLVFNNRAKEAQDLINTKMMAVPLKQASYQPAGLLHISFEGHNKATDYRRELDLERALTRIEYKIGDIKFKREIFSSAVDNVAIIHISADKSGKVNFTADFNAVQDTKKINTVNESIISLEVNAEGSLRCYSQVKAITSKGKVWVENNTLHIENADDATLFLVSATNYINYNDTTGNPESIVDKQIKAASKKSYSKIRARHIKEYQRYFNRVKIDFGVTEAAKQTTDLRIKDFANGNDPQLAALYFQFARYLLISCSRPGCQPANLQGLWNDSVKPPWSSKYTININTEMNYWPAEPANLSECHEPLFGLIKDISVTGRKTAKINYGSDGWVCHHNTDLWRATGPIDSAFYGFWPSGGA
ncbi:MAG: hypothetical protein BWY69_01480 [Planctomycetes bacterium ADurb.Bin401]|nr:MAG: hypothetical protein BWY69_01480 [Planctomycetes bacterium ADurb.Bin401]